MLPLSYSLRSISQRRATTVAAVVGIALVAFIFACVQMLSNGVKVSFRRTGSPDVAIVLRTGAQAEIESHIDRDWVPRISTMSSVARNESGALLTSAEVVVVILLPKLGTDGFSNVQIRGMAESLYGFRPHFRLLEGRLPKPGTPEVLIGRGIRGRFEGLDMGDTFELKKNQSVQVVGVFEDDGSSYESEVWADLDLLRAAFGRESIVSVVRARLRSPDAIDAFRAELASDHQLGVRAEKEIDYFARQSEGVSAFILAMGTLLSFLFAIGATLCAVITMQAAVSNRQREIGTLRALGFGRRKILASFLREGLFLGIGAGAIGAVASLGMSAVRISTMNFVTWSEIVFSFEPKLTIVVASIVAAAVIGLLGGLVPSIRAALTPPARAMRA